jgi:hypothetical protein
MEILELLLALPEMCGCFLQLGAAFADLSAGLAGYRLTKERKRRKKTLKEKGVALPRPPLWPFWLLVFGAVLLTSLSLWRWLR